MGSYTSSGERAMGIPFYFRVITTAHPSIITATRPLCKSFYVDFNGMIHQAAQRVMKTTSPGGGGNIEEKICDEAWTYLQECVNEVQPKERVSVCVDGVAPVAKMAQQRKRRFLSKLRSNECEIWDRNAITPGTAFMRNLQNNMIGKIARHSSSAPVYTLSAADEPGEGEHKIFAELLDDSTGNIIYGLDADLIMLSLMSHNAGIYLMRETDNIPSSGFTYLSVDCLRVGILKELVNTHKWPCNNSVLLDAYGEEARDVIESYLVGCFLLGNDFLPHITSLDLKHNGHIKIMAAAAQSDKLLVKNGVIDIDVLSSLLQILQVDENNVVMSANDEYIKRRCYNKDDPDSYPLLEENKDIKLATAIALAGHTRWRAIYYKNCFDSRMNDTSVVMSACNKYITGIAWTYAYYKRKPKDCMWFYPFGYAPTILDLANHLQACRGDIAAVPTKWAAAYKTNRFVHPDVQLLSVLPPDSVPERLREFVTNPAKGCAHLFPTKYRIKTYLFGKLWECVPVLPSIDVDLVTKCLGK